MSIKDKNYLGLQFWEKIYQKSYSEYQAFFEDIMQLAYPDFQKVRPYGNDGDGGNDGYRPEKGIYYQVYSPKNPKEKEAVAATKLTNNFKTLKEKWDPINKINEYNFTFNDKNTGVSIKIRAALSKLAFKYKGIKFKLFTPKDLENIFFTLTNNQILNLGFDIDSRKAISLAKQHLEVLEAELDRDNTKYVNRALENIFPIIEKLNEDDLILEIKLLEARTLNKSEKIIDAKKKYEHIITLFPADPRSYAYLAEYYLCVGKLEDNEKYLQKAEKIDANHWLVRLERLIRNYKLGKKIDLNNIDEGNFPEDPKIKSNYYRIYSGFLENNNYPIKADSFIEKAILLNPNKVANYNTKISILEFRVFAYKDNKDELQKAVVKLLSEIREFEEKLNNFSELSVRSKIEIIFRKFNAYRMLENYSEIEKLAKECFDLLLQCYFDNLIDQILFGLLTFVELPQKNLDLLKQYLKSADKPISEELAKRLVFQYNLKDSLFTDGLDFFKSINNDTIVKFINDIEKKNYKDILTFIASDLVFAQALAATMRGFPDLRKKIIDNLPNNDPNIKKDKLRLLLNYDEGDIDEAFNILKTFDLSNLGYFEYVHLFTVAQKKKAWDFSIKLLNKILELEKDEKNLVHFKLQLFKANFNLEKFLEAIEIGESILSNKNYSRYLDDKNKENLLAETILALLKRGDFPKAKKILEKYIKIIKTFEFILGIKTTVYIENNDGKKALESIVEGIKIIKNPTPEQYGHLFLHFTQIGNLISFHITSEEKVIPGSFVKLEGKDQWYFIGEGEELDATKILPEHEYYSKFINNEIGKVIVFENRYRADNFKSKIELILPIEKYLSWQCHYHAQKLTVEKRWDAMEIIDVPPMGDTVDPKFILAKLEDVKKARGQFPEIYNKTPLPFAMLAYNQGGITNALAHIINEDKGFVHFSSGDKDELDKQKQIALKAINGDEFYIDGTSALVLSETGLLLKIQKYIPNIKIPQSVISSLLELKDKFRYTPGHKGYMGSAKGRLHMSSIDHKKRANIEKNFNNSIKLLESRRDKIEVISAANKSNKFSESKIETALSDACILAQRDKILILTEDYLYLKYNELETKKAAPNYFSSYSLIRVIYEQNKISFDEYLAFFSYLSSYRFRFLPITTEDIEKAVIGDSTIKIMKPENIHLFNFPLTLSEDYGVPFNIAFNVVAQFLVKMLTDDSIMTSMIERIFAEIISSFPTAKDKKTLGQLFLRVCIQIISTQRIILGTKVHSKLISLSQFIEIYNRKEIIIP